MWVGVVRKKRKKACRRQRRNESAWRKLSKKNNRSSKKERRRKKKEEDKISNSGISGLVAARESRNRRKPAWREKRRRLSGKGVRKRNGGNQPKSLLKHRGRQQGSREICGGGIRYRTKKKNGGSLLAGALAKENRSMKKQRK